MWIERDVINVGHIQSELYEMDQLLNFTRKIIIPPSFSVQR